MATSSVNVHEFERLRPLGKLEQFSSARHHLGFYNNVGVSASYSTVQDLNNIKENVLSAVAIVIRRHPILSAIPVDEDSTTPYFARLPTINLDNTVTFIARKKPFPKSDRDQELDNLLEVQHNTSFKANYGCLPFWRLIVLTNSESERDFIACFIYHHSLGDGISGVIFQKHFEAALAAGSAPLTSNMVYPPQVALLPSLEEAQDLPVASSIPCSLNDLWTGGNIATPMISHFQSLLIPKISTDRFIQACRVHGTTVTSTIPVVIARALMQTLSKHFTKVECTMPVNIRRWLPSPIHEDAMGTWIDAFSQYYRRENLEQFWDEARRSKENIAGYLRRQSINVAKFKDIPDMKQYFLSKIGLERSSSFDVSNLGGVGVEGTYAKSNLDQSRMQNEGWKSARMVFSRSAFVQGSAFSCGLITGRDGCLNLGFAWQEGVIERDLLDSVLERIKSTFEVLLPSL